MPRKKSAFKALRKSEKRFERNHLMRKKIKDLRKKALREIEQKKKDAAMAVYREFQKVVDKASKAGGFMKKNTVARYKARLLKRINAIGT